MRAGLIDDFIRNILFVPFCPYHFVHAILSNTILSVYHFVHTILSVPFCPLPFCPRTKPSYYCNNNSSLLTFVIRTSCHPKSHSILALFVRADGDYLLLLFSLPSAC